MDSPFLKWYSPILEVGFPHYSGTEKPSLGELVNLGNCFLLISTIPFLQGQHGFSQRSSHRPCRAGWCCHPQFITGWVCTWSCCQGLELGPSRCRADSFSRAQISIYSRHRVPLVKSMILCRAVISIIPTFSTKCSIFQKRNRFFSSLLKAHTGQVNHSLVSDVGVKS